MAWNTRVHTGTRHKEDCTRVFKNYDVTCPRCQELAEGARPRKSWTHDRDQEEKARIKAIRSHDCIKSGCGPVCTAFDW